MGGEENLSMEGLMLEEADILGERFFVRNVRERCRNLFAARLIPAPSADAVNFAFTETKGRTEIFLGLVFAFAEIHRKRPDACLYILGECPGEREVEREIEKLHLEEKIFLMGKVANPWAVEKDCHCLPDKSPEALGPFMREVLRMGSEEVQG